MIVEITNMLKSAITKKTGPRLISGTAKPSNLPRIFPAIFLLSNMEFLHMGSGRLLFKL